MFHNAKRAEEKLCAVKWRSGEALPISRRPLLGAKTVPTGEIGQPRLPHNPALANQVEVLMIYPYKREP